MINYLPHEESWEYFHIYISSIFRDSFRNLSVGEGRGGGGGGGCLPDPLPTTLQGRVWSNAIRPLVLLTQHIFHNHYTIHVQFPPLHVGNLNKALYCIRPDPSPQCSR